MEPQIQKQLESLEKRFDKMEINEKERTEIVNDIKTLTDHCRLSCTLPHFKNDFDQKFSHLGQENEQRYLRINEKMMELNEKIIESKKNVVDHIGTIVELFEEKIKTVKNSFLRLTGFLTVCFTAFVTIIGSLQVDKVSNSEYNAHVTANYELVRQTQTQTENRFRIMQSDVKEVKENQKKVYEETLKLYQELTKAIGGIEKQLAALNTRMKYFEEKSK